jgi:hypothetical protein
MGESAAHQLLERGVWTAPYLIRGHRALVAVTRFGVVCSHTVLLPGVDPVRAADALEARLDRLDPPIALVRDTAPTPGLVKYGNREIDPRLLSDPRSPLAKRRYWSNIIKNSTRRITRFDD